MKNPLKRKKPKDVAELESEQEAIVGVGIEADRASAAFAELKRACDMACIDAQPIVTCKAVRSYTVNKQHFRVHVDLAEGASSAERESAFLSKLHDMAAQKFGAGVLKLIADRRFEWKK